jgi:hypothetical protein
MIGEPGKGIHRHFMGIAWIDVLVTLCGCILLSFIFNWDLFYTIIGIFTLGIISHRLFCVRTSVDKFLFP